LDRPIAQESPVRCRAASLQVLQRNLGNVVAGVAMQQAVPLLLVLHTGRRRSAPYLAAEALSWIVLGFSGGYRSCTSDQQFSLLCITRNA